MALGVEDVRSCVEALTQALNDKSKGIQKIAREALEDMKAKSASEE